MKTSTYKGATIVELCQGLTCRFNISGASFNPKGYPTMNHAKGAITKVLKAAVQRAVASSASVPVAGMFAHFKAHTDAVRKPAAPLSRNKREGRFLVNR